MSASAKREARTRKRSRSTVPKLGDRLLGVHVSAKTQTAASLPPGGIRAPPASFVDENETARQLGVAVSTLQSWRVARKGPAFYRFGRRILYSVEETATWAKSRRVQSTSEVLEVNAGS